MKRSPLTKSAILNASLRLADEHGLEQLSMRKVAQSLNAEAMSLYNHIKNKEDLLDGILGLVVSEFELPPIGESWKRSWSSMKLYLKNSMQLPMKALQGHQWRI